MTTGTNHSPPTTQAGNGRSGAPSIEIDPVTIEVQQIVAGEHADPHHILGVHADGDSTVVRAYRPGAEAMAVVLPDGRRIDMANAHAAGVFCATVPAPVEALATGGYQIEVRYPGGATFTVDDPYRFWPTIGELDLHLIGEGRHELMWCNLGAHVRTHQGVAGTSFAVWAPNARGVRVVGDFNSWDGRLHPARRLGHLRRCGSCSSPPCKPGDKYKFEIIDADGQLRLKADPFAFATELPPGTASVVFQSEYRWNDDEWLARPGPSTTSLHSPHTVYECHLGSWRTVPEDGDRPLTYRELAEQLPAYLDRARLHPRGVPAGGRAPLRPVMGLPGVGLLRPHGPVRHARRLPGPGRRPPRGGHRRARRLGAGPLPEGRLRPGPLRRHGPLRARRPPPGRAPRLGDAGLQLRAQRGPQLPAGQRPVLGAGVPRRRAAGRRRGVDAVPRLLPRRRASGSPTSSGAGRTSRRSTSSRSSTPSSSASTPVSSPWPRSRRPGRWCRVRRTSAASGSPSSGTWAGCTTPSTTSTTSPSTAATTTTS